MSTPSIEEIILTDDRRGVSSLKSFMPNNYCSRAAELILDSPGKALIATGFYILAAEAAETDGPPGAVVIGKALESIGFKVSYVTDLHCEKILGALADPRADVVNFPIESYSKSKKHAKELLDHIKPTVAISVERCGFDGNGLYLNMHGMDISGYTAKLDYLFIGQANTVGIGDGGNEIGMGNLAPHVLNVPSLVDSPCTTTTSELIISSVSNWGAYGLVTAISKLTNLDLLISVEEEQSLVKKASEMGAVDSISLKTEPRVDGFDLDSNSGTLNTLHKFLESSTSVT